MTNYDRLMQQWEHMGKVIPFQVYVKSAYTTYRNRCICRGRIPLCYAMWKHQESH